MTTMVTAAPVAPAAAAERGKLALLPLVALVVGSMIGGGVFNLPRDMSTGALPGAIVIGWAITGVGMLMLAVVYQSLAVRKPALNAGPYAKAGFGDFVGFNSAWGYWISAFLGNAAYAVAIFSALSYFAPVFGNGNTLPAIIGVSICLWAIHIALVFCGLIATGIAVKNRTPWAGIRQAVLAFPGPGRQALTQINVELGW